MYAISTVDAQKMSKMVASMQVALKGDPAPRPRRVPLPQSRHCRSRSCRALGQPRASCGSSWPARLQRQIRQGNVELDVDSRGLVVSIREAGSFASGSAELSEGARALLAEIAAPLSELPHPVRIEGHTDDTPIRTARFRSNWELSTARATQVIAFLQNDLGLPRVAPLGGRLRRVPSARGQRVARRRGRRTAASTSSS